MQREKIANYPKGSWMSSRFAGVHCWPYGWHHLLGSALDLNMWLCVAIHHGHLGAIEILLPLTEGRVVFEDGLGRSLLWWASKYGSVSINFYDRQGVNALKIGFCGPELYRSRANPPSVLRNLRGSLGPTQWLKFCELQITGLTTGQCVLLGSSVGGHCYVFIWLDRLLAFRSAGVWECQEAFGRVEWPLRSYS